MVLTLCTNDRFKYAAIDFLVVFERLYPQLHSWLVLTLHGLPTPQLSSSHLSSPHRPTTHAHNIRPPHTPTTHAHYTRPLHTPTTHVHHTRPPHTPNTHAHHTRPSHTPTTHAYYTRLLHTPTTHAHNTRPLPLSLALRFRWRWLGQTISFGEQLLSYQPHVQPSRRSFGDPRQWDTYLWD